MNTGPIIRCATENDARSIAKLARALGYAATARLMRLRVRDVLQSPADLLIVAVDSSAEVIGWLQAHAAHVVESGFRVEIVGLIVSPTTRRRGAGRALVSQAERWARKLRAKAMVVRSNVKRVESHAFYPALGYTSTKTQLVYRKSLGALPRQHTLVRGSNGWKISSRLFR